MLAHEVARQLIESGDTVEILVLLDPRIGSDVLQGPVIDDAVEQSLRALDPERFEEYRTRCVEADAAAIAYRPSEVSPMSTIFFVAEDNANPTEWQPFINGPLELVQSGVAHHEMGSDATMADIAHLFSRRIDPRSDDKFDDIRRAN